MPTIFPVATAIPIVRLPMYHPPTFDVASHEAPAPSYERTRGAPPIMQCASCTRSGDTGTLRRTVRAAKRIPRL